MVRDNILHEENTDEVNSPLKSKSRKIQIEDIQQHDRFEQIFNEMQILHNKFNLFDTKMCQHQQDVEESGDARNKHISIENEMKAMKIFINEINIKILRKLQAATDNFNKAIEEEIKVNCKSQKELSKAISVLQNNIQLMKSQFINMEKVISTKADCDIMQQKVSLQYFENTKRTLTNSMLQLISQLAARENNWQKSLNELNKSVEMKMNKDNVKPITDYLNKRVDSIQDRLRSINLLKRETEAAGTKYRLLKGVKCISCDNNAMMKVMETTSVPRIKSLQKTIPHKQFISKLKEQLNSKPGIAKYRPVSARRVENQFKIKIN